MGVQGPGEQAAAILRQRPYAHPYAIPPTPGGQGVWLVRQPGHDPLGYVVIRPVQGGFLFDIYAHCRDDSQRRPRLHAAPSLNSVVAWAIQHASEIRALIARSAQEPEAWPA